MEEFFCSWLSLNAQHSEQLPGTCARLKHHKNPQFSVQQIHAKIPQASVQG